MSEHPDKYQSNNAPSANIESALIISLKEARKILGKDARTISDEELALNIWHLMDVSADLLKLSSEMSQKHL